MAQPQVPPSPWQSPKYTGEPWWTKDTVVLVTGSNRGIGYEIVRQMAKRGFTVVLTDKDDTEASMAALKEEGVGDFVFSHPLDVTSSSSVATLAAWVKKTFGGIDILFNNAGVWGKTVEDATTVLTVNYFGAKKVTEGLLPLMRPGGRIINVSSRTGFYQRLGNEKVKSDFENLDELSFDTLDAIANQFLEDVKSGQFEKKGWVPSTGIAPQYSESKMLLSAYTLVLNKSLQTGDYKDKKVYACAFCPGFTETDMTKGRQILGLDYHPVQVGVDSGMWLALLPPAEFAQKQGKLVAERVDYPYTWVPWIDPFVPPS